MAETLIIRLGSRYQDKVHWLVTSADKQEIIASGELISAEALSDLTEKSQHRKVVTLVPASDVVLKAVQLPSKSLRAMKQAVPFMLEEELAQPVEDLFFAYANIKDDQQDKNCFTAIVEKRQLELWLSWLEQAGINCSQMLPDALAMPLLANSKTVIALDDQILLREEIWQATLVDQAVWQLYTDRIDEPCTIAHYSALATNNENIELSAQPEELPLFLFAKNLDACPVNLLQAEFTRKQQSSKVWQTWRLAAGFAITAFCLLLAGKFVQLYKLDNQQAKLEENIQSIYQKTFASKKGKPVSLNKVKALVKARMRGLISADQSEKFFPLIDKVIPAFITVKALKPETLKYDHKRNEIRIQASAKSYQDFERFKAALEKENLVVSQGSQNNQGDQISGSFSIKDAS